MVILLIAFSIDTLLNHLLLKLKYLGINKGDLLQC